MSEQQPYIVSARKYRPSTFKSVVGQKALTSTLKNAIDSQRLAQAYLFCGPRGVGKTSCARIFAKTINCLTPTADGEACGQCESCRAIERGNSFNLVELDAASNNSVDDIRSITEQVNVPPQKGRYRVFIIDEVHMLSNAAFNAFLKTLEEPPKYVIFILATTEKHKVIPTILSRCQIYDFKRITINDIIDHLEYVAKEEGIVAEREALGVIALKADGAMRDALSIFDQVSASSRGEVTYQSTIDNLNVLGYDYYFRLVDAFRRGDVAEALLIYKEIRDKGFDSLFFINGLFGHVRDLMVSADSRTVQLLETPEEIGRRYVDQAKTLPVQWYYAAMKLLNDCDFNYKAATSKRLLVELTLIRLCQLLKPAVPPFDSIDRQLPLGAVQATRQAVTTDSHEAGKEVPTSTQSTPTAPAKTQTQSTPTTPAQPQSQSSPHQMSSSKPLTKSNSQSVSSPQPSQSQSHPRAVNRPSSYRLNSSSNSTQTVASSLQPRNTPITQEGFMTAWGEFIAKNPSLHILVNAMRGAIPQAAGNNSFIIVVDHPAQEQAFEHSMPKLISFMRDALSNDLLTLKVEINTNTSVAKQLPPKEFLKQVVENNPVIAKFLQDINAEMV